MYPTIEKYLPKKDRQVFQLKGEFVGVSHKSTWLSMTVGKVVVYHFKINPDQIPQKKFKGIRGREVKFPALIKVEKPKGSQFRKRAGQTSEIIIEYASSNDQYFFGQKAFNILIDGVLKTYVN